MSRMHRWNQIAVLVATLAIAGLPLLHNHPLIPDAATHGPTLGISTVQCAICATLNAPAPLGPDTVEAPKTPEADLIATAAPAAAANALHTAGSRAPPTA